MIGVTSRILDSMLLQYKSTHLTHKVLSTLLAEGSEILNAKAFISVSSNPDSPFLLTPATLLQKKLSSRASEEKAWSLTLEAWLPSDTTLERRT